MTTTKDIGDQLEIEIEKNINGFLINDELSVSRTKGSGNQRGDGDIKIKLKDEHNTILLMIDAKNSHSKNGTVPSKQELDKLINEANMHFSLIGGVLIRKGKDKKAYAACSLLTMYALIKATVGYWSKL